MLYAILSAKVSHRNLWCHGVTEKVFPTFDVVSHEGVKILTANIFESEPMPTPWKSLDMTPLLPSCKLGQN